MSDTRIPPRRLPRALHALVEFFRLEAAGGITLIAAAALALLAANSPLHDGYEAFRGFVLKVGIGDFAIAKPLLLWINDGLMAIFFLLVALEIKRETLSGQLAGREQLILPLVCASAGVIVPAALFTAFNHGDAAAMRGWAVPTATDIAFALGVLALLGSRVPVGMKLLLSTIAVVDDLIAILIIALFYSHGLSLPALGLAALVLVAMWALNRFKVTALWPYLLLGAVLWVCVLKSGVHATLAGVATGLLIPHVDKKNAVPDETEHSPLETLEHALHPWVAYAILPVFAFANAGLVLGGLQLQDAVAALPLGIALGLVLGKPIGIVAAALAMRAAGWARYPAGMDLRAMLGLGMLCGIGFTMSLFIASLGYVERLHYEESVLGILAGSVLSALLGYFWLRAVLPARRADAR
ncbi:Na+/H+ antiporter NhaA [Lysobacter solisilvae (ex Woo and Kim 2020)]|uniref:Na(+)/H(+) antiporter NhaA n=1 Tax=Agrilutibacter terrestris TaxID=2865112 RepID=A0A7H0FZK2_9GAMM|nr:Na+/H+ antiporter NhaA [Lysobacter terrestris]QNP41468.1 Na+/H+ antiporter NhaA [Lysobacter terrestris]